jgi:hypothetical protein
MMSASRRVVSFETARAATALSIAMRRCLDFGAIAQGHLIDLAAQVKPVERTTQNRKEGLASSRS